MPALFWLLAAFLPIVPDFDAFGTLPYGSPFGHRGFTHSLLFALGVGMLAAVLTYRYFKVSFWDLGGFFFVVTASHGVLDAFTNGGYGVAFFWPLNNRYGPWGPIRVSDLGFEFPDPRTSRALQSEFLWVWLPTAVVVAGVTLYRRLQKPTRTAPSAKAPN
jgi:inner membrane protein